MNPEIKWRHEICAQTRRIRKWLPWIITDVEDRFYMCGEWAPTIVEEYEAGRRPGRTWGTKGVIEITDADYKKWPELLTGYPGHPDTITFNLTPESVHEDSLQWTLPTLDI